MTDFLSEMVANSRLRAKGVRDRRDESELIARARSAAPAVALELSPAGFDLIAESKLASPSEGRLTGGREDLTTVVDLALSYVAAGAAAISVLTEPTRFDGHLSHLTSAATAVELPVMRKDFLVDPIQVLEARAAGASGVLLIARILERGLLVEMTDLALSHGMFVLVELFEERDIDVATSVFGRDVLIGVNSRDLETLRVDGDRHARLASQLPSHLPLVAESGLLTPEDAVRVSSLGYRLGLVGSSLVASPDPASLLSDMVQAGRAVAVGGDS